MQEVERVLSPAFVIYVIKVNLFLRDKTEHYIFDCKEHKDYKYIYLLNKLYIFYKNTHFLPKSIYCFYNLYIFVQ